MSIKSQPWIHSWYGDILGLHGVPIIFGILAIFSLAPFHGDSKLMKTVIAWILVIDWAHIFAQWHRIYANPMESTRNKWVYPVSYFLLVPCFAAILHFSSQVYLETFLIYFVIYHFIKQNYGYIRIYSRVDGPKTQFQSWCEDCLIYTSMVTPVLYWHHSFPNKKFYWKQFFLNSEWIHYGFYLSLSLYITAGILYLYFEVQRSQRNQNINVAKNIALFAAAFGWGLVALLDYSPFLIFFTIVLAHDLSYTFFVWFIGRRDKEVMEKKISWFSWWSVPGFFFYLGFIVILGQVVIVIQRELVSEVTGPHRLFGTFFQGITYTPGWWAEIGMSLFFATQAHHYFIDRFLWKREKDLVYMIKTGKKSLS